MTADDVAEDDEHTAKDNKVSQGDMTPSQALQDIAKSCGHRLGAKVLNRYLIDIEDKVFAILAVAYTITCAYCGCWVASVSARDGGW